MKSTKTLMGGTHAHHVDEPRVLPADTIQEVLWQENDFGVINTGSLSVTMTPGLPSRLLRSAAQTVVAEHAVLRSLFRRELGCVVQQIRPQTDSVVWTEHEYPVAAGEERDATRKWISERYRIRRWDLALETPIKFHLLHHGQGRQTLAIPVHHIGFDGRSKFVFARAFASALHRSGGRVAGTVPASPFQPFTELFDDSSVADDQLGAALCSGPPAYPRAPIATEQRRPESMSGIHLNQEAVSSIRAVGAQYGTTLFGAFLGGVAGVWSSYGNSLAVVGIPMDISRVQTAGQIGAQINLVPAVMKLEKASRPSGLLERSRQALDDVYKHRRMQRRDLAVWARGRSGPLTGLSISYVKLPDDELGLPGVSANWDMMAPNFSTAFDMALQFRLASTGEVFGRLDYVRPALTPALATSFLEDLQREIHSLRAPSCHGASLSPRPIPQLEKYQPGERTLVGRARKLGLELVADVLAAAAVRPDGAAVVAAGVRLTFAELAKAAGRGWMGPKFPPAVETALRILRDAGAGRLDPGIVFAVAAERSRTALRSGDTAVCTDVLPSNEIAFEFLVAWAAGASVVTKPVGLSLTDCACGCPKRARLNAVDLRQLLSRDLPAELRELSCDVRALRGLPDVRDTAHVQYLVDLRHDGFPVARAQTSANQTRITVLSPHNLSIRLFAVTDDGLQLPQGVIGEAAASWDGQLHRLGQPVRALGNAAFQLLGPLPRDYWAWADRIDELEMALSSLALDDVFVAIDPESSRKAAVILVVPHGGHTSLSSLSIQKHLASVVPDHHPIRRITLVNKIPRDRQGEPSLGSNRASSNKVPAVSGQLVQERIRTAWCEALGVTDVRLDDDFLDLGGHSLLGTQVLTCIQASLGVRVTLRELLDSPSLGDFISVVELAMIERLTQESTFSAAPEE